MDSTSFRYMLALAVHLSLDTYLMDVVITYLYGKLDADLYIALPPDFLREPTPTELGKY